MTKLRKAKRRPELSGHALPTTRSAAHIIPDPATGAPAFAVLPYPEYAALVRRADDIEDATAARQARAALAAGTEELLPLAVAQRIWGGESRVRVYRERRGLSQAELGRQAGVRQGTISDIETGAKGSLGTMRKIAQALGVSIADILPRADA